MYKNTFFVMWNPSYFYVFKLLGFLMASCVSEKMSRGYRFFGVAEWRWGLKTLFSMGKMTWSFCSIDLFTDLVKESKFLEFFKNAASIYGKQSKLWVDAKKLIQMNVAFLKMICSNFYFESNPKMRLK